MTARRAVHKPPFVYPAAPGVCGGAVGVSCGRGAPTLPTPRGRARAQTGRPVLRSISARFHPHMSHPACCITSHIALSHNFRRAGLCLDCAPRRTDYRIPGSSDISFPGGDGGAGGGARAIRRCRARIQAGAQHALHHPSNLSLTSCCASTSPPRAHHPRVPPSTGPPHPPYQACCLGRWLCTGRCPS